MTKRTELAWAAGFFDGEGCFARANSKHLRAIIKQVDPEVLHRFQTAVGGRGKVYGPRVQKNPRWKPQYEWTAHGEVVREVYDLLEPYLSTVKREQAARMFSQHRRCKRGHFYAEGILCPTCILNRQRKRKGLSEIEYSFLDGITPVNLKGALDGLDYRPDES